MFGPCFVISTLCPSRFAIIVMGEDRESWLLYLNCLKLSVFLMSCDCSCSLALPRGAVGLSTVCDCGIP